MRASYETSRHVPIKFGKESAFTPKYYFPTSQKSQPNFFVRQFVRRRNMKADGGLVIIEPQFSPSNEMWVGFLID